eukprot:jgi/Mesvir1/4037/Mv20910-RA.1
MAARLTRTPAVPVNFRMYQLEEWDLQALRVVMGKSIRAKRERRLRAAKQKIVEPLEEKKLEGIYAALAKAAAAPKIPVYNSKPRGQNNMAVDDAPSEAKAKGGSSKGDQGDAMEVEVVSTKRARADNPATSHLGVTGGVKKNKKKLTKRAKSKKHKKNALNF